MVIHSAKLAGKENMQLYHINYQKASNDVLISTLDYFTQILAKQTDVQWSKLDSPLKREYKEALFELRKRLVKK